MSNDNSIEMDNISSNIDDHVSSPPPSSSSSSTSFIVKHSILTQRFHSLFLEISSPLKMLIFFTVCNFLNYIDRGAFAGSLSAVSENFDLSNTQEGLLGASFMLGYMIFAPLFGHLSRKYRPAALMSIGLCIWCGATLFTGFSFDFWSLLLARAISGVGEASFIGLAPTYIDDIAPLHSHSVWLGIFFSMIPIGAAAGYGIAGIFTQYFIWRFTFIFEVIIMFPIAISCWFIPYSEEVLYHVGKKPKQREISPDLENISFIQSLKMLFGNIRYDIIVLGYSAVVFVAGALYFWAPEYVTTELGISVVQADLGIGIITVFCGLFGTAFGGWLVDKLGGTDFIAACVCFFFSAVTFPIAFVGFLVNNVYLFFILVTIAELMIFAITSPINVLCLNVVEVENRSFSITMQIFFIHLLGDFPSPFIIGAIADHSDSLRVAMVFCCLWMIYAVIFFGIAIIVIYSHDKNNKKSGTNSSVTIHPTTSDDMTQDIWT